jgi:hypothetical protein
MVSSGSPKGGGGLDRIDRGTTRANIGGIGVMSASTLV